MMMKANILRKGMMLVGALTLSFQSLTPPTGLRKVEW